MKDCGDRRPARMLARGVTLRAILEKLGHVDRTLEGIDRKVRRIEAAERVTHCLLQRVIRQNDEILAQLTRPALRFGVGPTVSK